MSPGFWGNRNVLITGDTGFKGAWLALWLEWLGARVTGFALPPPTRPSLFVDADLARSVRHVDGDIRDPAAIARAVAGQQVVFHLAAQSLVRRSYREPQETFATNVMGTVNVAEAVRHAPSVEALVVVTTDKCYENQNWVWGYRENDPLGGHEPYSASKACAELVAACYRRAFFAERPIIATTRAGNVIGGGDWAEDRLVPDLARAAIAKQAAVLRHPTAVRPWQHVLDPLAGYLMLAERLAVGDPQAADAWNFGPASEDAIAAGVLADLFCKRWGQGAAWRHDGTPQLHEAATLRLDCSKAHALLNWRPRLRLHEGLNWTGAWYRAVTDGRNARDVTLEQIDRFMELGA